jgi:DNA-binding NarL/FixJ family response regulator
LSLLVDGLSKKQIAEKIFLSHHTVDSHLRNIYAKLEVHSRSSAISKAIREKLL